jgi:hypothetical protein
MSAPTASGSLARLFPVVTPAPAAAGAGRAHPGPSGAGSAIATALTAESGLISSRQGSLIVLVISAAVGIAVFGAWFTVAGPGRAAVVSLARRRGRHTR